MKCSFRLLLSALALLVTAACSRIHDSDSDPSPEESFFTSDPKSFKLSKVIEEISGIADSKTAPGHLWAHEDSGKPPVIHLLSHTGEVIKSIYIKGVKNRDWEDIVLSGNQLFIGDIGDNDADHTTSTIYQITEPLPAADSVLTYQRIRFRYPDGPHDAEAFLIDPKSQAILIITKSENPSRIFKIAAPYKYTSIDTAQLAGNLNLTGVVSAALSPSGKEAILKTYTGLFYFKTDADIPLENLLQQPAVNLPYKLEPQGEAITFAGNNSGFFTLSEKGFSNSVSLYFYARK